MIYQWVAETQTWRSYRPGVPPARNAFDTFTRGATYWIRAGEAVEWTIVGGPIEPPATDPIRLHLRWTEVVWRGADGAPIAEAFGAAAAAQNYEVVYHWDAETQTWGSYRPGAPSFVNAFDSFTGRRQLLDRGYRGRGLDGRRARALRARGRPRRRWPARPSRSTGSPS